MKKYGLVLSAVYLTTASFSAYASYDIEDQVKNNKNFVSSQTVSNLEKYSELTSLNSKNVITSPFTQKVISNGLIEKFFEAGNSFKIKKVGEDLYINEQFPLKGGMVRALANEAIVQYMISEAIDIYKQLSSAGVRKLREWLNENDGRGLTQKQIDVIDLIYDEPDAIAIRSALIQRHDRSIPRPR